MADKKQFRGHVEIIGRLNYISDPVNAPAQTTTTLTKNQSGAAVLLTPNAGNVVLLDASPAGQRFEFVMAGDRATANNTVTTADTGQHFIGGISTGAGGKSQAGGSADVATFNADANAGDRFECVSSGAHWYIVGGYCEVAGALAFA